MMELPEKLRKLKLADRTLDFRVVSGEVVDHKVWSETNVRGSGHWVGPHGRGISDIVSDVTEILELILRTDEGKEDSVRLYNSGVHVRNGHRISLIYFKWPGKKERLLGVYNRDLDKFWEFGKPEVMDWSKGDDLDFSWGGGIFLAFVNLFFIGWLSDFANPEHSDERLLWLLCLSFYVFFGIPKGWVRWVTLLALSAVDWILLSIVDKNSSLLWLHFVAIEILFLIGWGRRRREALHKIASHRAEEEELGRHYKQVLAVVTGA